jgi:hypothetical protein
MEKIKLSDIDLKSLRIYKNQGSNSIMYEDNNTCIKIITGLFETEKEELYKKILEFDGMNIEGVILPKSVIVEGDKLQGYIMEKFENSTTLCNYYERTRYVNVKDILKSLKEVSLILRNIHDNNIICQDFSLLNVLIDEDKNIKFCDIDAWSYKSKNTYFISLTLKRFLIDYRNNQFIVNENTDRISLMLEFFLLIYFKELQKLSKKQYHNLSDYVNTLENAREYAKILVDKDSKIPNIPYIDELIDERDDYIIDRTKQLNLIEKIQRLI